MLIHEFYAAIDGDYESARKCFYSDAMLEKFLIKFLDEPGCAEMNNALAHGQNQSALCAVHTMTAQARCFGFSELEKKSAALLKALRGNCNAEIVKLRCEVTDEYSRVAQAIRSLDSM